MSINFLNHRPVSTNVSRLTRVALVVVPILILGWILNNNFLLTSSLSYSYRSGEAGRVVAPKTPTQLFKTADPKLRWRISVDNFLFNVTIPRLIEAVRVRVRLDAGTQPYVVLSASTKKGVEQSKIINAATLNTLDWKHVTQDGLTLWMRDKHISEQQVTEGTGKKVVTKTITTERTVTPYDSVDAFRANPPDMSTVGLVGVERMAFATIKNYQPSATPVSIGHTLRGSHQLYVYAANETLKLTFDKIDLNRATGADSVTVRVTKVDDLTSSSRTWLKTVTVGDDGVTGKDGPQGKARSATIELPNVAPGVYHIDIETGEDVLLDNLTSNQQNLAFNGRVFIADGPAYAEANFTPVKLITSGPTVTVAANHDQGKQDVTIAGKKITIKDVKVNHVASALQGTTTIDIPKGDIIVTSDELLSFGGFSLLPDGARGVDVSSAAPDFSAFDYILADYVPQKNSILDVDQTYMLRDLDLKEKTLTFSIDAPGLQASGATLGLKDIRVTMVRGHFPWDKIWKKLGLINK